jgi:integrase
MTWGEALEGWFGQLGDNKYRGNNRQTIQTALRWLRDDSGLGTNTQLDQIGTPQIADAIGQRRGQAQAQGKRLADATINRTVTELVRRVLNWARDVREVPNLKQIAWSKLLLTEKPVASPVLSPEHEAALLAAMRPDYAPIITFLLRTGARKEEAVGLRWADVDMRARLITLRGKGYGGEKVVRQIPLMPELVELLLPLRGHHPEHVFTYIGRQAEKRAGRARGQRYPITYNGLRDAWDTWGPSKAGIAHKRLHDLRHTAGTRIARSKGGTRAAQLLLGHSDIKTTQRYDHAGIDDVRAALEAEAAERRATARVTDAEERIA